MAVNIGNYTFEGAYSSPVFLEDRSGVYAVLGCAASGLQVLDIGESGRIESRVSCHDRASDWARCGLSLRYAALYCDEPSRMRIERELRVQFNPTCGAR